jgi:cytochrome P450
VTSSQPDEASQQAPGCPHLALNTRQFADNFYETLDECRAQAPLAWDDTHGWWVTTRAQTLSDIARDWQGFTSQYGVSGVPTPNLLPMDSDPPLHDQWRSLLNVFFTKRKMDALAGPVAQIARRLLDPLHPAGEADFIRVFTTPLPGQVFFELVLGLTDEQLAQCNRLVEMALNHDEPGDGSLLDTVVHAQVDGHLVSVEDAVSVLVMLILGGLETTSNTLGNVLLHLGRDHALQARLRENPELLPTAVEEFLRLYSPTIYLVRQATRDADIDGQVIRAGQTVALSYASAGRDPAQHDDPAAFRLDREHYRHQTFGLGIHRCLGSNLARVVLRVALEVTLAELSWETTEGFVPVYRIGGVRALERLPLSYRRRPKSS